MQVVFKDKYFFSFLINLFILFFFVSCGGSSPPPPSSGSDATVQDLSISPFEITLSNQSTRQLMAQVLLSDASIVNVTDKVDWQSDNELIVSVNAAGLISAKAVGAVTVTAAYKDVSSSVNVTVSEAALTEVAIKDGDFSLAAGTGASLEATGIYADLRSEDLTSSVSWSSDNTNVATVDENGVVQAKTVGTVDISASINGIIDSVTLTVTSATLTSISISPASFSLSKGTSQQLLASGLFSDGSVQNISAQVEWSVNNTSIAAFDTDVAGKVNALSIGSVIVAAQLSGIRAEIILTVSSAVLSSIEIISSSSFLPVGTTMLLEAVATFSDGTTKEITADVEWLSSGQLIFSIDNSGVLHASGIGSAIATAVYLGNTATLNITVSNAVLTEIQLSPLSDEMAVNSSRQFTATGIFSDNSTQNITDQVNWSSSDEALLTIDNQLDNKGLAQSIATGVVSINAEKDGMVGDKALTITPAILTHININPANLVTNAGAIEQYQAIAQYSDGSVKDITDEAEWSTSDPLVATSINNSSTIQANQMGQATINARFGEIIGIANLTVNEASLVSISLNHETVSVAKGTRLQLVASGLYSDTSIRDISHEVSWSSSAPAVASVKNGTSNNGELQAVSLGDTTITAEVSNLSATVIVTVTTATLTSIEVIASTASLLVGDSIQLTASGMFSDSSTQDISSQVTWSSSDVLVAAISNAEMAKGVLQAFNQGTVEITASLSGVESSALNLTVNYDPDAPVSISLIAAPNVILNNNTDTTTVAAILKPAADNGVIADDTQVDFVITEGATDYNVTVGSVGGVVSLQLATDYSGPVSVTATVQQRPVTASTVILSVTDFNDVIVKGAFINPISDAGVLLTGSSFGLLAYNISNRDFTIQSFEMLNDQQYLPGSPVDGATLGNGELNGGELLWFIYELSADIVDNGVSANLYLTDPATGIPFGYKVNYFPSN